MKIGFTPTKAKATGHMASSSRCASCMKPNVAYLVLNRSSTVSGVLFKRDQVLERFRGRFLFRDLKM
jgi:hypothetical protein